MKFSRLLLTVLFTTSLLWGAADAGAIPGRAEVKKIVGTASVIKAKAGSGSQTLKEGDVLESGDSVTTGRASTVDLWLGINGDALRLDPETTLRLDILEIKNVSAREVTTSLILGKGQVTGNVATKLSRFSKYEVKTANGVAGIRGTIYSVRVDGTLIVARGSVTLTFVLNGVTQSVQVEAGSQFKPGDAAPSPAPAQTITAIVEQANEIAANTGGGTATTNEGTVTVTENPTDVTTSGN